MTSRTSRRRLLRGLAVVALAGALTASVVACSSDSDSSGDSGHSVTIDHTMGSTTVKGTPTRIVALGSQWLDATEALGVTPVGYVDNVAMTTGGAPGPWEPASLKDSTAIDPRGDIMEQVAKLRPDLILAPGFATDKQSYDKLSKLAPTIPNLDNAQVEPWDKEVSVMGQILGKETEAKAAVEKVNAQIDAVGQQNPGLKGKTFVTSYLASPTQLMVIADPNDGSSELFTRLGMVLPPHLVKEVGAAGRTALSPERIGDLDADLLVISTGPGVSNNLSTLPGWSTLPSVQKNSVAELDLATATGLNVPTVLSVPYVLQKLQPALVNAAK